MLVVPDTAVAMGDCCSGRACELEVLKQRQTSVLHVVLGINALLFLRSAATVLTEARRELRNAPAV